MRRSEALNGVHGEFLSQMSPDKASGVLKDLAAIESNNKRWTTEGGFTGEDRDTLVLFSGRGMVLGAAVIHRLPAVDVLLGELFDSGEPLGSKARLELAYYLQARVEGYLHGLGQQEYLAVVPLEGEKGWISHILKMFDSEQFPAERFAVFRRRL